MCLYKYFFSPRKLSLFKVSPRKAKSLKSKKHRGYKVKIKKDIERGFNKREKMNKKNLFLIILLGLMLIMPLVSAATTLAQEITTFLNGAISVAKLVFTLLFGSNAILGKDVYAGQTLAIQILIFALVTFFIYGLMDQVGPFQGRGWLNVTIGALVSIIGIRFLPAGMLEAAAMPSSAFVAILVMGLPLLLLFYVLEGSVASGTIRRAVWACYAALIVWLWIYNWDNANLDNVRGIYPAMILACIIAFWFDGTLQKWMNGARSKKDLENINSAEVDMILSDISKLRKSRLEAIKAGDDKKAQDILVEIKRYEKALSE